MEAITAMPDRDELQRRIRQADPNGGLEALYPGILKMAGRELHGSGVAVMLSVAVSEHMRDRDYGPNTKAMMALFMTSLPPLVKALVDDDQVRADALEILKKAGHG